MGQSAQATLEIRVSDWVSIRALRSTLAQEFGNLGDDTRDQLVLAATELVENGLLHAERLGNEHAVTLRIWRAEHEIELCAITLSSDTRAHAVIERVAAIEAAPNKRQAYVARLLELARAPRGVTSQLGFHRIALESGCSLHASLDGGRLTVCARRHL
jgi:hypothetical protein